MSDTELEMYMDTLRENVSPFERFVSRGDKEDVIDVPGPRKKATRSIKRTLMSVASDGTPRLLPILGEAGSGKTHLYWVIYDKYVVRKKKVLEKDIDVVYVSSPPAPVRILGHVYNCLLDDIGNKLLEKASQNILKRYGVHSGLLRRIDVENTITKAVREFPGISSDIIKALVIFGAKRDKTRAEIAERYLLGEILTDEQMEKLGLRSQIEEDDVVFAAMKTLLGLYPNVVILYFDELEIPYRIHGPEAAKSFVENLKHLYNEVPNILIVTACLKDIWPKILEKLDQAMRTRMEPEVKLKKFTQTDLQVLVEDTLRYYWENVINVYPPRNLLFPLTHEHIEIIHEKSAGNPRQAIKLIRAYLDALIEGEDLPHELPTPSAQKYAKTDVSAEQVASTPGVEAANQEGVPINLDEDLTITVNPQFVTTGMVNSFKAIAEQLGEKLEIHMDYKFVYEDREYNVSALIVNPEKNKKIIIETPSVKSFDKKGGVAGYYALKRLQKAFNVDVAPKAILVVPEGTGGAKYTKIKEDLEAEDSLHVCEINEDTGEELIRGGLVNVPTDIARNIAKFFFEKLPKKDDHK